MSMKPLMSNLEVGLFQSSLQNVSTYFEYGIGGSTVFAWELMRSNPAAKIYGVDTSLEWVEKVRLETQSDRVLLTHKDVGETRTFGYPVGKPDSRWMAYSKHMDSIEKPEEIGLVLVDGRFRVACLIQALLKVSAGTKILLHDYYRASYQVVENWAKKIERVDSLVLFETPEISEIQTLELSNAYGKYWKQKK